MPKCWQHVNEEQESTFMWLWATTEFSCEIPFLTEEDLRLG